MYLYCPHRSYSKNHETVTAPNLTLAPLAPPVHPRDSHTPGRGPAAISRLPQELHNGDVQPTGKSAPSSIVNRANDMDTDGEIDVDDCNDREYPPKSGVWNSRQKQKKNNIKRVSLYKTQILQLQLLLHCKPHWK